MDNIIDIDNEINSMRASIAELRKGVTQYGSNLTLLEAVWDTIPAIMFYKDKNNNLIKVNNYFCNVLGGKKSDYEMKNIDELMIDNVRASKYSQNDIIVIKSNKPKLGIIEQLFDSNITVRTDKFPVRINDIVEGVLGFSVVLENYNNGQ